MVGWVTSGGYAHYSEKSLALGYVAFAIVGRRQKATLLREPVLDPAGARMRR